MAHRGGLAGIAGSAGQEVVGPPAPQELFGPPVSRAGAAAPVTQEQPKEPGLLDRIGPDRVGAPG